MWKSVLMFSISSASTYQATADLSKLTSAIGHWICFPGHAKVKGNEQADIYLKVERNPNQLTRAKVLRFEEGFQPVLIRFSQHWFPGNRSGKWEWPTWHSTLTGQEWPVVSQTCGCHDYSGDLWMTGTSWVWWSGVHPENGGWESNSTLHGWVTPVTSILVLVGLMSVLCDKVVCWLVA